MIVTRFAPSPTGPLHLGHAFSALTINALAGDGRVLLRMEDTDTSRARRDFEAQIMDDLRWLGFAWAGTVRRQSEHVETYRKSIARLATSGLIYPCSCTRRNIAEAGARLGRMGLVYPGTCRRRAMDDAAPGDALRLNVERTLMQVAPLPVFRELGPYHAGFFRPDPDILIHELGDPVLQRGASGDISYDLACPHDDSLQGVTHVIRGIDLWDNTPLHVLIQTVMGWPVPDYVHHDLVCDETGRRLSKVDRSRAIARYRDDGMSRDEIIALLPPLPTTPLMP